MSLRLKKDAEDEDCSGGSHGFPLNFADNLARSELSLPVSLVAAERVAQGKRFQQGQMQMSMNQKKNNSL